MFPTRKYTGKIVNSGHINFADGCSLRHLFTLFGIPFNGFTLTLGFCSCSLPFAVCSCNSRQ